MPDRTVRFADSFFDRLDSLFPTERGADGTPSSTDFLLHDLPPIRTIRDLVTELPLTPADGVPTDCVVNFDNIHTIPRDTFRRRVTALSPARMAQACRDLQAATGC